MIKKTILGLALMMAAQMGYTQQADTTTAGPVELTLEKAKQYAMEHNRTLQASGLQVQKAEQAKWEALAGMLLNVDGTFAYTNYLGYEPVLMGNPINMPNAGQFTLTGSVAFNGQILVGYQISKMAVDMQNTSRLNDELTVKSNVTTSYLTVLIAEESYKILQESRENIAKTYNNTQQLASVGMAEQTQADQLKVQLMTMDNQMRSAKRNIELAYNALRLQLGTGPDTGLTIQETINDYFDAETVAEHALAQENTLDNNITLQMLDQNIELQEKQVTLKKWAYGPTVALAYTLTKKTFFGSKAGFDMTPPQVLSVNVSLPIFSSGKRLAQVRQQKIAVDIEKTKRDETADGLRVQERQLAYNLSNAIETCQTAKQSVELNQKIFKNQLQKYEQGMVSSTDLVTVNSTLLQSQSSYIQSLYEVMSAQTSLLQLYNKL